MTPIADPKRIQSQLARVAASKKKGAFQLLALRGRAKLSRHPGGYACIVVELTEVPAAGRWRTKSLGFESHARATIEKRASRREAPIAVVKLLDDQDSWRFAVLAADMARVLAGDRNALASARAVNEYLRRWQEVFRPVVMDPGKVLGLWGEVHALSLFPDADAATDCWHGPDAKTFDFGSNDRYIEVKASQEEHLHWFSLDQVHPPAGSEVYVLSLHVRDNPASGESLHDVVARVRETLRVPGVFDRQLAKVGYSPDLDTSERFSVLGQRFVAINDVPRPREIDDGVDGVRFRSDCSGSQPVDRGSVRALLRRLCEPRRARDR